MLQRIGGGAFGTVYRARDTVLSPGEVENTVRRAMAKLTGGYNAVKKRQGRQTGGPPGGRKGRTQGDAEVVQVDGFHGETGVLRLFY